MEPAKIDHFEVSWHQPPSKRNKVRRSLGFPEEYHQHLPPIQVLSLLNNNIIDVCSCRDMYLMKSLSMRLHVVSILLKAENFLNFFVPRFMLKCSLLMQCLGLSILLLIALSLEMKKTLRVL